MGRSILGLILVLFYSCNNTHKTRTTIVCTDKEKIQSAIEISFDDLYASKKMDGKIVTLEGFFAYNFEDIALYPSRTNLELKEVWLDFDNNLFQDSVLKKIDRKKIKIIGTINFARKGHLGFYICTLQSILCIEQEE